MAFRDLSWVSLTNESMNFRNGCFLTSVISSTFEEKSVTIYVKTWNREIMKKGIVASGILAGTRRYSNESSKYSSFSLERSSEMLRDFVWRTFW